jgi:hypothetical protein
MVKFGSAVAGQDDLATSKNPLGLYLDRAAQETMRQKYMQYLSQNQASFGGGGGLSGGLAEKLQAQGADQVNDVMASKQRGMPLEYSEKMVEPQQLMDMRARKIMADKAAEQMRAAERAGRKQSMKGAGLATVGAIAGGIAGGPAGAAIGGGAGGLIGGGM